jgi:TPR repeat protein
MAECTDEPPSHALYLIEECLLDMEERVERLPGALVAAGAPTDFSGQVRDLLPAAHHQQAGSLAQDRPLAEAASPDYRSRMAAWRYPHSVVALAVRVIRKTLWGTEIWPVVPAQPRNGLRLRRHVLVEVGIFVCIVSGTAQAGWEEGQAAFFRKDYATAFQEWLPLAKQGHAEAQLNIGFMHNQGLGVGADHVAAPQWFRKAADQGLPEAQATVGTIYFHGLGVAQNYSEAFMWSMRAAEQGHRMGQFNVGSLYLMGQGVSRDHSKAALWLGKAADQGDAASQFNLSYLYEAGLGVTKDPVEALKWLILAPRQVHDPAISMPARGAPDIYGLATQAQADLRRRLTGSQVAEAERRARAWKPVLEREPATAR